MHNAWSVIISLEDVGLLLRFAASRPEPRIVGAFDDLQPRFPSRLSRDVIEGATNGRNETRLTMAECTLGRT